MASRKKYSSVVCNALAYHWYIIDKITMVVILVIYLSVTRLIKIKAYTFIDIEPTITYFAKPFHTRLQTSTATL